MARVETPIGSLSYRLDASGALVRLSLGSTDGDGGRSADLERQIEQYFARERTRFDFPLAMQGTPFQRSVWQVLMTIPFGQTRSYQQVAEALGRPSATRAVGAANGANPIALIVPCHRVIGSNGKLTGYAGGLEVKARLLDFEQGTLFSL